MLRSGLRVTFSSESVEVVLVLVLGGRLGVGGAGGAGQDG